MEDLLAGKRRIAVDGVKDTTVNPSGIVAEDVDGETLLAVRDVAATNLRFDVIF